MGYGTTWTRIPPDLQWLNEKVDTWPVTGLAIDSKSRKEASKAARLAKPTDKSSKYGPGTSNSGGGGKKSNNCYSNKRQKGIRPCIHLASDMHILDVLNAHTNTNIVTISLTVRYTEFQESKTPGWCTFQGLIDTGALQGNYMSY